MDAARATKLSELFDYAQQQLVAGVSAGARLNAALGHPLYLSRGDGCHIYDVDGKEYIDFNNSHGATFLGHNHPGVRRALELALDMGVICAYETEYHSRLAALIVETIPCAETVRLANSGTEATLTAIRLARAATGRKKLLKFEGHFHGLHDWVMWNAHSPRRDSTPTWPYVPLAPDSAGIPPEVGEQVVVIPWNDPAALEQAMKEQGDQFAAVICEPICYNSGCITPAEGLLPLMRRLTQEHGAVLIFDEVLSAFRTGADCAQGYYGVTPDLCTIAKAIANGIPVSVVAGKRSLMEQLSPKGEAAHSGTYSGHLFPVMAATVCLEEIRKDGFYPHIYAVADRLYGGLTELFRRYNVPARVQGLGGRFGIYFGITEEVKDYQQAMRLDPELTRKFIKASFDRGVYFHNYGKLAIGHHGFSAAHTLKDIDEALNRIEDGLKHLSEL